MILATTIIFLAAVACGIGKRYGWMALLFAVSFFMVLQ